MSKNVEIMHYRIQVQSEKQKILWCETLLAHTGCITSLHAPSSSAESIRSSVEPVQDTSIKVPTGGAGEAGRSMSAEENAARVAALAAIQHIRKPLPPPLRFCHHSGIRQCL